jgi:hypothetical protein
MKKTYKTICAWAEKTFRPSVEKYLKPALGILPPPPKGMEDERAKAMKEFHQGFTIPMAAFAGGFMLFAVLLDYTFQLIDAIDILTL